MVEESELCICWRPCASCFAALQLAKVLVSNYSLTPAAAERSTMLTSNNPSSFATYLER